METINEYQVIRKKRAVIIMLGDLYKARRRHKIGQGDKAVSELVAEYNEKGFFGIVPVQPQSVTDKMDAIWLRHDTNNWE